MVKLSALPFKVGRLAEARSFEKGYLGAWFPCKIKRIRSKKGRKKVLIEYLDYEGPEVEWVKLYEVPVHCCEKSQKEQSMLMLRPPYPHVFLENQMPCVNDIREVAVVVNDAWKEGDLVDGLDAGCYWSGRIMKFLDDGKAMIKSPEPPMGEGLIYEFPLKVLRPSLDWSPEYGWTLPTLGDETNQPCAQLIKPGDQGQESQACQVKAASQPNKPPPSHTSDKSLPISDVTEGNTERELHELSLRNTAPKEELESQETKFVLSNGDSSKRKTCSSDTNASSHIREALTETAVVVAEGDLRPLKKYQTSGGMSLNSQTLEGSILDLEELVNKVKWLKSILQGGLPLSNAATPQWKVMEHIASSWMSK